MCLLNSLSKTWHQLHNCPRKSTNSAAGPKYMMPMHVSTMMNQRTLHRGSGRLRAINWSRSWGSWGGNLFLRLGDDKDTKHSWWVFSFWSGSTMVGSFNDINGSTDQIIPQEDPRSKKFSGQYDYSLHSVPHKTFHQIQTSKKLNHVGGKHKHKRRHRRSKNKDHEEDVNPTDIVAEILGNLFRTLK